jgi:hypothetical protein
VLAVVRPDGKAPEIREVPEAANKLLSARDRAITPKTAELIQAIRDPVSTGTERVGTRPAQPQGVGDHPARPRNRTTARRWSSG